MTSTNDGTSVCGHCRFYHLTGRRGGECHQFGVPVKASWKACSLAQPPFEARKPCALPVTEVLGAEVLNEAVCGAIAPLPLSAQTTVHIEPKITSPVSVSRSTVDAAKAATGTG
ncbi:MAG: hypothetical protein AAFU71_03255 [Cyanobacteria bacterium J06632_22]